MTLLNRLQALAFQFSSSLNEKFEALKSAPIVGGLLHQYGLSRFSDRTSFILSMTKNLEAAIREAEEVLESNDVERLRQVNQKLATFGETIESWTVADANKA
jgi:type II secretory pathway component PulF